VDIPPKKGTETGLYTPKGMMVPFSGPFLSGISTEEGNKKYIYRKMTGDR
jgi:hypothetical protein